MNHASDLAGRRRVALAMPYPRSGAAGDRPGARLAQRAECCCDGEGEAAVMIDHLDELGSAGGASLLERKG